MKMSKEMSDVINILYEEVKPWEMTAEQKREFELAKQGNQGALCDLLASLGMESDDRFTGFYDELDGGTDPDTIRTVAELETNRTLVDAFIDYLESKPDNKEMVIDAGYHYPEQWRAATKRAYVDFLARRAETQIDTENKRKAHPRGGWKNPASAENGKKGGRPKKFKICAISYRLCDDDSTITEQEVEDFPPDCPAEMTMPEIKKKALEIMDMALSFDDYFDQGKDLRRRPFTVENDGEYITVWYHFNNNWAHADVTFTLAD